MATDIIPGRFRQSILTPTQGLAFGAERKIPVTAIAIRARRWGQIEQPSWPLDDTFVEGLALDFVLGKNRAFTCTWAANQFFVRYAN
jgi:hypothetical protein